MEELYRPITRIGKPLIFMSRESAEIVKYASNAFLATKISFINMMAELAEKAGGDIRSVAQGMGLDNRIGPRFLHADIGYGGSCFPKDVKALVQTATQNGAPLSVLEAVESANERQKGRLFEKLAGAVEGGLPGARVAVWGLSFKPNTDDMRESPALALIEAVLAAGAEVVAHDPAAMAEARRRLGDRIAYAATNYEALAGADALVIVTDWNEYRHPDFDRMKSTLRRPIVIDGRNLYAPDKMARLGFTYRSIGRGRE